MKKIIISVGAVALLMSGLVCGSKIKANDMPVSVSENQVIQETLVSDSEKEELLKLGISYDEIVKKSQEQSNLTFNENGILDKEDRFIFLSDGSMEAGPVDGEGSYIADGNTGVILAKYNPGKDSNSVDYETAHKLDTLRLIRFYVDDSLGKLEND